MMNQGIYSSTQERKIKYMIFQGNYYNYAFCEPEYFAFHYALKTNFMVKAYEQGQNYEVAANQFFLAKSSADYFIKNIENKNTIVLTFLVHQNYLRDCFNKFLSEGSQLYTFINNPGFNFAIPYGVQTIKPHEEMFRNLLYSLIEKQQEDSEITQDYLFYILKEIVIYIEYHFQANKLAPSPLIAEILNYIHNNLNTANLKELSKKYNYSVSYISEMIRKETGFTFSQILSSARMVKSLELLSKTDDTLQDICENIGYTNASSFITAFHETYKKTPNEYRKDINTQNILN